MNASHERRNAAAIFSACGSGNVGFLERWERWDADGFVNCLGEDRNGAEALVRAVRCNQPECVLFMLQYVDANAATSKVHRAFLEAAMQGHLRVLCILMEHGAGPNILLPGTTPWPVLNAYTMAMNKDYNKAETEEGKRHVLLNMVQNHMHMTLAYAFARHEDYEETEEDVDDVIEAWTAWSARYVDFDGIYDMVDNIVENGWPGFPKTCR
jgi:hypothetical protein